MGDFVKKIVRTFTGGLIGGDPAAEEARKAAEKQEALAQVARDNQQAALQDDEKKLGRGRAPRGRRLLIAQESGEGGLKSKLG